MGKSDITFISAGAGSGKTYSLTEQLFKELVAEKDSVRVDGIIATTFTKKAAAELEGRVRQKLIQGGRQDLSIQISQSLIGTVNGVCGRLLNRFAFEAGLPPELQVIEEDTAAVLFSQALEQGCSGKDIRRMNGLAFRLGQVDKKGKLKDWRDEVRRCVELARANDIEFSLLAQEAEENCDSLLAFFPEPVTVNLDEQLQEAMETCLRQIAGNGDETKGTAKYVQLLEENIYRVRNNSLPWSGWVKLSKSIPTKRSKEAAQPVIVASLNYDRHPRLHSDIRDWIRSIFRLAANTLTAYQEFKAKRGVMDFVDQEKQVLELLDQQVVQEALADEIDLLLVDEFQDTSPIQLAIFLKLSAIARKSIWVGDIKQAIYGFRGSDPELMNAVVKGLKAQDGEIKILKQSWRSRPQLVELVNALFIPAFADILKEEQVRLTPALTEQCQTTALEFWTLSGSNVGLRLQAIAEGVAGLIEEGRDIVDKETKKPRPLCLNDIALLFRTNDNVAAMAAALNDRGIPAQYSRSGLLSTPEVYLGLACLRYLVDKSDIQAVAEIIALGSDLGPEKWLQDRLEYIHSDLQDDAWGREGTLMNQAVCALDQERQSLQFLSPAEALDLALNVGEVERIIRAWGPTSVRNRQRLANVEALRAYGAEYEESCGKEGRAATAGGFLLWIKHLAETDKASMGRDDRIDAVHLLTHHAAKGLEWPVVVAADLDKDILSRYWGFTMEADLAQVDLDTPLADRKMHYWVKPFGKQSAKINVYEQIEANAMAKTDREQGIAEAKRLLYVSFTRARDLLVLPFSGKIKKHPWLDCLEAEWLVVTEGSFDLPNGGQVNCGHKVLSAPEELTAPKSEESFFAFPGQKERHEKVAAFVSPSSFPPVDAAVGTIHSVSSRITFRGKAEMDQVGNGIHSILAADCVGATDREEMATKVLKRWGIDTALIGQEILNTSKSLQRFLRDNFVVKRFCPEWPVQMVLDNDQLLSGWIDLAVETENGWLIIDHKSFPAGQDQLEKKALEYSGQLQGYKKALEAATGQVVEKTMIFFPVSGRLVEVVI